MRVIIPTLVGLVALAATSVQAAPVATKPHLKWHETPAQNVRKSMIILLPATAAIAPPG